MLKDYVSDNVNVDAIVTLKMNKRQAHIIYNALELYTRLKCAQFDVISSMFGLHGGRSFNVQQVDLLLKELKHNIFPEIEKGAYIGIHEEASGDAKEAYDIEQVLRNGLAWFNYSKGGFSIDFHKPYPTGSEPLPYMTIKKIKKIITIKE